MRSILLAFCAAIYLSAAYGQDEEPESKVYVYVRRCRNVPNGFCVDQRRYFCPEGYAHSYNGCGFREYCCYPRDDRPTRRTTTTERPGTGSTPKPTPPSPIPGFNVKGKCGIVNVTSDDEKIVGGVATTIEENPWQVSLRFYNQHICGGSLITDKWVLTAAHCIREVEGLTSTSQLSVLVGSTNSKNYPRRNVHSVKRVAVHGGYTHEVKRYDMAMIELNEKVDLSDEAINTICLPSKGQRFDDQVCRVTGWGTIDEDIEGSVSILRKVNLPVLSQRVCSFFWGGYLHPSQFCAADTSGGRDSCQGDSGGPLVCKQSDGSYIQAGVVSLGLGCAKRNTAGLYTDVGYLIDWIEFVMKKYESQ